MQDASDDPEQIHAWWTEWPDANVGIATGAISGLVVIVIDPLKGGEESFAKLQQELPSAFVQLLKVRTGSGGTHLYFQHPGGHVPCRTNVRPGIHVKADGDYVVAPPSLDVNGVRYRFASNGTLLLPPLPQTLWDLISAEPQAHAGAREECKSSIGVEGLRVSHEKLATARPDLDRLTIHSIAGSVNGPNSHLPSSPPSPSARKPVDSPARPHEEPEIDLKACSGNEPGPAAQEHDGKSAATLEIQRLARLSPLDYEGERESAAQRLSIRVTVLDDQVKHARAAENDGDTKGQGRPISFPEPEPCPHAVDGAKLLDALSAGLRLHVVMSKEAADATALWAVHTYLMDVLNTSPKLAITSPEKGCGKTTLLDVLGILTRCPLPTANATPAAIFRAIEIARPTLLIDEADTFLKDKSDLRGILNSGHRRNSAYVVRAVPIGDGYEPRNQWSPFEQAFHLYKMQKKGYTHDQLLARFRMSRGYLNAKVRAYKLLVEAYVPMVQKAKKEVGDLSRKWSWFEEFYKKCKPSPAGKEDPDRVYDGPALEQKFCQWMLNDQLPRAEDVRRLYDCLEDKKAIAVLDKGGTIDKAHIVAAATRPELVSKLWKSIEEVTDRLNNIPLSELDALRAGDATRAEKFNALLEALQRVRTETRVKQ